MPVPLYDMMINDPRLPDSIRKRLTSALRVDATNIAHYFFVENEQEEWFFDSDDFPMLVPPLSPMWIEAVAPPFLRSEKFGEVPWRAGVERPSMWGAYITTEDDGPGNAVRWRVTADLYITPGELGQKNPLVGFEMDLAPDGRLAADGTHGAQPTFRSVYFGEMAQQITHAKQVGDTDFLNLVEEFALANNSYFQSLMLAVCFMHCKNVALDEVAPPARKRTSEDRRFNHWPKPPTSFHTLNINPFKQVVARALTAEGTSANKVKRGLHIMRGHFRTYDETSNGLFGKYHGTFWIPMHVRGGADHVVEKDYTVTPPKRGEQS